MRRHCPEVIATMLEFVPIDREKFIEDLKWNFEDASYKSPEETIQWERTMRTLIKHIPIPKEDWEFNVLSIFTTRSIENLKTEAKEEKYWRV